MGNVGTSEKFNKEKKITDLWDIKKKLGKGSFGTVRLCIRKAFPTVALPHKMRAAVKIINKKQLKPKELANLDREAVILAKADHPNCVQLFEYFDTKHKLYLCMELCEGGELFDAIMEEEHFNEEKASNVVRQIASALSYLHDKQIAHRDLKPENILYKDKEKTKIKLMDFGLAKALDAEDTTLMTRCGTLHYVAPEVLSRKTESYTNKVDCWSLGVVTYVLLCGYLPFYQEDRNLTARLIRIGKFEFDPEEWSEISKEAKDLIKNLMTKDVEKRLTAAGVLEHDWLTKNRDAHKRKFPHTFSDNFKSMNESRKKDQIEIMVAMTQCSVQLRRWIGTARKSCGEEAPVADESPASPIWE